MIDIENQIYDALKAAVNAEFGEGAVFMSSKHISAKAKFPCVSFMLTDSAAYTRSQDSGSVENHARVYFEANVYASGDGGEKSEAKRIAYFVDGFLATTFHLVRTSLVPIQNLADATVFRMVGRYAGIIGADGIMYTS